MSYVQILIGTIIMYSLQVGHVINYEFPEYVSDYIHRSGRVGRVGSAHSVPLVTSLVSKEYEVDLVQSIEVSGLVVLVGEVCSVSLRVGVGVVLVVV